MPPQHPEAGFADGYVVGQRRRAQALQFPSREPEGKETRPPGAGGGCAAARSGWTCGGRFRCSRLRRRFLGEGRAAGDAPSQPKTPAGGDEPSTDGRHKRSPAGQPAALAAACWETPRPAHGLAQALSLV